MEQQLTKNIDTIVGVVDYCMSHLGQTATLNGIISDMQKKYNKVYEKDAVKNEMDILAECGLVEKEETSEAMPADPQYKVVAEPTKFYNAVVRTILGSKELPDYVINAAGVVIGNWHNINHS